MEVTTVKSCIRRFNALCKPCGKRPKKAFDDRKIILCKINGTELYGFHQFYTLSDMVSKHTRTLSRLCYIRLLRLKCS